MLDLGKLPMKFANTSDECSVINVANLKSGNGLQQMWKAWRSFYLNTKKNIDGKKKINSRFKVKQFLRNKICEELPE